MTHYTPKHRTTKAAIRALATSHFNQLSQGFDHEELSDLLFGLAAHGVCRVSWATDLAPIHYEDFPDADGLMSIADLDLDDIPSNKGIQPDPDDVTGTDEIDITIHYANKRNINSISYGIIRDHGLFTWWELPVPVIPSHGLRTQFFQAQRDCCRSPNSHHRQN